MSSPKQSRAAWYVGLAYALWGFFPIYWKALAGISSLQLICHRIVWSFVHARGDGRDDRRNFTCCGTRCNRRASSASTRVAAVAIAINWLIFVWAVGINQIVQISLGYFINPLLSVRPRDGGLPRAASPAAVDIGRARCCGCACISPFALHAVPWIALSLAATFGTYGLMKKLAPLGPVQGLAFETGILFVPAARLPDRRAAGRARRLHARRAASQHVDAGFGPVTTLPLLLFAAGVRRIPLSLVGMLQYINPTMQITIGVHALRRAIYANPARRIRAGLERAGAVCYRGIRHEAMATARRHGRVLGRGLVRSCDIVNGCPPRHTASGGRYGSQENGACPD